MAILTRIHCRRNGHQLTWWLTPTIGAQHDGEHDVTERCDACGTVTRIWRAHPTSPTPEPRRI